MNTLHHAHTTLDCPTSTAVTNYGKMIFFQNDEPIGKSLKLYGESAGIEIKFLENFIRRGDFVVDVGANIGTHTLAFSKFVGSSGTVLAFEPQPNIFRLLQNNVEHNGLTNIKLVMAGVGDKLQQIFFNEVDYTNNKNSGAISLLGQPDSQNQFGHKGNDESPVIRIVDLDSYNLQTCQCIKIDAEGMELDVIKGMSRLLAKHRPLLYVDCCTIKQDVAILSQLPANYNFYLVRTAVYNPYSYNRIPNNIFEGAFETALFCVPNERAITMPESSVLCSTFSVKTVDDFMSCYLELAGYGDKGFPHQQLLHEEEHDEKLYSTDNEIKPPLYNYKDKIDNVRLASMAEINCLRTKISELTKEIDKLSRQTYQANAEVNYLMKEFNAVLSSLSWVLTKPLRDVKTHLGIVRRDIKAKARTLFGLSNTNDDKDYLEKNKIPKISEEDLRQASQSAGKSSARIIHSIIQANDHNQYRGIVPKPIPPSTSDWERIVQNYRRSENPVIDVVIPVYAGYNETMRCIFSVLDNAQDTAFNLVVINDCSPDTKISSQLSELAKKNLFDLHDNSKNLGFVASCNFAISLHPQRDIILLNSDTQVYGNWIERLREAAYRHARTGTVTPFSNNAEICSYPKFIHNNQNYLELEDASLDQLAKQVNAGCEVEIPTAVGFCMYIRRDFINEVGVLDEERFGKGYGEENDLCRRGVKANWRNILAPNVFVRHYGGISFGSAKAAMVAKAVATVEQLHPGYNETVAKFIADDPVFPFRQALDIARMSKRTKKGAILFVLHRLGGGTEAHVQDLSEILRLNNIPTLLCWPDPDDSNFVVIEDTQFPDMPNLPKFSIRRDLTGFVDALSYYKVKHLHIHHIMGLPADAADFFRLACEHAELSYDVTIHDYMFACPRIRLTDGSGFYCGEPAIETCESCMVINGSPFGHPSVWAWREKYKRFLADARKIFVPDVDVQVRMKRFFPEQEFTVRPHPEKKVARPQFSILSKDEANQSNYSDKGNRRIALLGSIGVHKGVRLLEQVAKEALKQALPIEFTVIGYTDRDALLKKIGNVEITGEYTRDVAIKKLQLLKPDFVWLPSVWPETYSYTLSEAFDAGFYPVAFDMGAIANRIRKTGWGNLTRNDLMNKPAELARYLADLEIPTAPQSFCGNIITSYDNFISSYYELPELSNRESQLVKV